MSTHSIDDMPHVMGDDGEFHAQDEAVDLSGTIAEAWVALGFFWVLGGVVFYQFFTRYVVNDSLAWTEEIARYLLTMVAYLGGAIAVRKFTHIHVEFLYVYLPRRIAWVLSVLVDLARIAAHINHPQRIQAQSRRLEDQQHGSRARPRQHQHHIRQRPQPRRVCIQGRLAADKLGAQIAFCEGLQICRRAGAKWSARRSSVQSNRNLACIRQGVHRACNR